MESCRKIDLPKKVSKIINILQEHGYEAYAVGGCVRDTILGRTPEDWDITTFGNADAGKRVVFIYDRYGH